MSGLPPVSSNLGREASWKPAQMLTVKNKHPEYRYRWRDKDRQNIQKAEAEGWIHVNPITGLPGDHENPGDQESMTSTTEYRELTLMALPEETAQARDEYFQERTDSQTRGLKRQFQRDLAEQAEKQGADVPETYGKITID